MVAHSGEFGYFNLQAFGKNIFLAGTAVQHTHEPEYASKLGNLR
jgi:hypothetical protein